MAEGTAEEPEDGRALYRLPPDEFTAARDRLVRRLRAAGDRTKAEEVRKLRRPNPPAWALNQVAQGQPELIEEVLAAGNELREAMEIGDARLLREAERSTRQATDAVVEEAARVLTGAGHGPSDDVRSRLAATLRAAIVNPDVASQVQGGVLERDVELAGFGLEGLTTVTARPARSPAPRPKTSEDDQERQGRPAGQQRDERQERERREERRRREEVRRATKRRLAELESEAKRLTRQAERLAAVAQRAEEEARQARADAESAATEAERVAGQLAAALRELEDMDAK